MAWPARPGIAAQVFGSLGAAGVNVRAIAQGSSERNISVVIDERQTTKALRSVHSGFYLSPHTISLGIIGPGAVGGVLLDQLASQTARLTRDFHIDLRLRAVMTSRAMALSDSAIPLDSWRDALEGGQAARHAALRGPRQRGTSAARGHPRLQRERRGRGAVSALAWRRHPRRDAEQARQQRPARLCTTTCRKRGGRRARITSTRRPSAPGCRSSRRCATCARRATRSAASKVSCRARSRICSTCGTAKQPFSEVVRAAKANGYTEPDPRDDLSGTDVARKLVILGREMGLRLELVERRARRVDSAVARRVQRRRVHDAACRSSMRRCCCGSRQRGAEGNVLRYVAALDAASGRATVGLVELDRFTRSRTSTLPTTSSGSSPAATTRIRSSSRARAQGQP